MVNPAQRLDSNVDGEFFVDSSCIDCEACRWVAPDSFDGDGTYSRVYRQPANDDQVRQALMALLTCPVSAIGSESKHDMSAAKAAFPEHLADGVYYCGYHSSASYGASSYFIRRPHGNVLVDSPRFARDLVNRLEALGGIDIMFLSHRDDVADHQKFADYFGCRRIMHADDMGSGTRMFEQLIDGADPVALDDDLLIIPVPGHTRGSACLLYREHFLFTGDHLWWNPDQERLRAGRRVCWYDWPTQIRSMERLRDNRFSWVLPGHGWRHEVGAADTPAALDECIAWMTSVA